jgi:hypothetical protein
MRGERPLIRRFAPPSSTGGEGKKRHRIQISNSDEDVRPHSRGAMHPRLASTSHPPEEQRAQGKPGADCTRGRAHKSARVDHRFNRIVPAFPARMGYGLLRALLGDRLVCHRRVTDDRCIPKPGWVNASPQRLTPASGRRNHTTSPSATTFTERSAGLVQPGKVPSKTVCSAVRPRAG